MSSKLEDEQNTVSQLQKKLKELQVQLKTSVFTVGIQRIHKWTLKVQYFADDQLVKQNTLYTDG